MLNFNINFKFDRRNLLLCYGDSQKPLTKKTSSIGLYEVYYDDSVESLVQAKVYKQL